MERRNKYSRASAHAESERQFELYKRQHQQNAAVLDACGVTDEVKPLNELITDKPEDAGWVVWFSVFEVIAALLALWKVVEVIVWAANKWNW